MRDGRGGSGRGRESERCRVRERKSLRRSREGVAES